MGAEANESAKFSGLPVPRTKMKIQRHKYLTSAGLDHKRSSRSAASRRLPVCLGLTSHSQMCRQELNPVRPGAHYRVELPFRCDCILSFNLSHLWICQSLDLA